MNIYFSNQIKSLYFFDTCVTFPFEIPIMKSSAGFSYVISCMCNGINNMDRIVYQLIDKFNVKDSFQAVKEMILSNTIDENSIKKAFTLDVNEANLSPKVNGMWGQKYPQILHIELTNTCNYMCDQCYKNAQQRGTYVEYDSLKERIYDELKGIVPVIHFTGGEPTIHENFQEIVELFHEDYALQLTTNGSKIVSYPIDVFKKFEAIDISLYGLSAEEYRINTGNANSFYLVKDGCQKLKESNINFRVTVVINNENWSQMEDYVQYAIEVGAESIGLALPMQSGKLLTSDTDKWSLSQDTKKLIYRKYRDIQKEYGGKIQILNWNRSNYSEMWKMSSVDDSLRCGAGKHTWWMSEKFTFRPCAFLPDEYVNLDYNTWRDYITNNYEIDWKKAKNTLELFASDNNLDITDLCTIFKDSNHHNQ